MSGDGLHPPEGAFDREAYDRFQLPRRIGEAVASWDGPTMVVASDAAHMRPDDYVIGVVVRERPRAYPLWVIDNYHAINDRVEGEPIVVASCERCQSGSVFRSDVKGNPEREPLFRAAGVLNAVLLFKDLRSGSYWNHYEGMALRGRAAGERLSWFPAYHIEWADWCRLHPDTEVMAAPEDPRHRDARHGHGREEFFARPGMDPAFLPTIVGDLDERYPENEVVLGLHEEGLVMAFPLREVQREGGVVAWQGPGGPLVVFAGPRPDGFTMGAFESVVEGRKLTFGRRDGWFADRETGTRWTIEGAAVDGPLRGAALPPVRSFYVRWHAWVYFHRDTHLFRSEKLPPPVEGSDELVDGGALRPFLCALGEAGHEVRIEGAVVSQQRPREAIQSLVVRLDGDPIRAHEFATETSARDFVGLDGAWSALPYRARLMEGRASRVGRIVVQSDPPERYADPAQIVPRPPSSLRWHPILDSAALALAARTPPSPGGETQEVGFLDVVRALRRSGLDVTDVAYLPPGQLRPGCRNGVALSLDGERFLLYGFTSERAAEAYVSGDDHAIRAGTFVLRSTPDTMYMDPLYEILQVNDEAIRWSPLLDDPRIQRAFGAITRSR